VYPTLMFLLLFVKKKQKQSETGLIRFFVGHFFLSLPYKQKKKL
jgi:hypothetical protein